MSLGESDTRAKLIEAKVERFLRQTKERLFAA